jgi:hypothetical protein
MRTSVWALRAAGPLLALVLGTADSLPLPAAEPATDPAAASAIRFIPRNCRAFVTIRVAELLGKLGIAAQEPPTWLAIVNVQLGFPLADIERFTLVLTGDREPKMIGLVEGTRPLPRKAILANWLPDAREMKQNGRVLHVQGQPGWGACFLTPRLLAFGEPEQLPGLRQWTERLPPGALPPAFAPELFQREKKDVMFWGTPQTQTSDVEVRDWLNIRWATGSLEVGKEARLELRACCTGDEEAARLARAARAGAEALRGQLVLLGALPGLAEVVPEQADLKRLGRLPRRLLHASEKALQQAVVQADGQEVTAALTLALDAQTLRTEAERFVALLADGTLPRTTLALPTGKTVGLGAGSPPIGGSTLGQTVNNGTLPESRYPGSPLLSGGPLPPVIGATTTGSGPIDNALARATYVEVSRAPASQPRPEVKDPYVAELLDILSQTKSVDAYLVTLSLLAEARYEPQQVLPVVIRNAERLGIYGRHALDEEAPGFEVARDVTELIGQMAHGKAPAKGKKGRRQSTGGKSGVSRLQEAPQGHEVQQTEFRTPIGPAVREGQPMPLCEGPPTDAEVLQALRKAKPGVPVVCEESRDDIRIVTELVKNTIDPPRFFPLIGPARLHHCHWKCTVHYQETIQSSYPVPFTIKRPRTEVVYLDRDSLHPVEASQTRP